MIVLDLSSVAILPEIEERVVQFVAVATDVFTKNPAHRYIVKQVDDVTGVGASGAACISFYPDATSAVTAAPFAASPNAFFFGNALLGFHLNAGTVGIWEVEVHIQCPGSSQVTLFLTTNVINTVQVREQVLIKLPTMPIYQTDVVITTGAASNASVAAYVLYNGFYFSKTKS